MTKISDITAYVETFAPLNLQEGFDNSGRQVGLFDIPCTGVLICVDVTEEIVDEAERLGCNLVISHHPLLFHATKKVLDRNRIDRVIRKAIKKDITLYCNHTSLDNAPDVGVSLVDAQMLGLHDIHSLIVRDGISGPVIGTLEKPMTALEFIAHVKHTFSCDSVRASRFDDNSQISKVALCGGAGAEFITDAIAAGAQAYLTSDSRHNYFLDYTDDIMLFDIGHFDSEKCTKEIFYKIITEKFPNFAVYKSEIEKNPIIYC